MGHKVKKKKKNLKQSKEMASTFGHAGVAIAFGVLHGENQLGSPENGWIDIDIIDTGLYSDFRNFSYGRVEGKSCSHADSCRPFSRNHETQYYHSTGNKQELRCQKHS